MIEVGERLRPLPARHPQIAAQRKSVRVVGIDLDGAFEVGERGVRTSLLSVRGPAMEQGSDRLRIEPERAVGIGEGLIGIAASGMSASAVHIGFHDIRLGARCLSNHRAAAGQNLVRLSGVAITPIIGADDSGRQHHRAGAQHE